jgi:hypothetical protein
MYFRIVTTAKSLGTRGSVGEGAGAEGSRGSLGERAGTDMIASVWPPLVITVGKR